MKHLNNQQKLTIDKIINYDVLFEKNVWVNCISIDKEQGIMVCMIKIYSPC